MKLGERIGTFYPDWRFVEADLYDVTRRVRDYDSEARLVSQDGTYRLGLARWTKFGGGGWLLACYLTDTDGSPLVGEPDARVLTDQKNRDWFRVENERAWRRKEKDRWLEGQSDRHRIQDKDALGEESEQFVYEWRKARNKTQDKVFIGGL